MVDKYKISELIKYTFNKLPNKEISRYIIHSKYMPSSEIILQLPFLFNFARIIDAFRAISACVLFICLNIHTNIRILVYICIERIQTLVNGRKCVLHVATTRPEANSRFGETAV